MALKKKIMKSVSWRVHASLATFIVSYLFTGEWKGAVAIVVTLMVLKFFMYVYHEKLWEDWLQGNFDFID